MNGKFLLFMKNKIWYILLLILSSIYIFLNRNVIYQMKEINATNLIFIFWLALLLLPLFSEMEFFGIKLKRELEKTKAEVKDEIKDLHLQLTDLRISNSNANTFNFSNGFLPTKHELKELVKEYISSSDKEVERDTEHYMKLKNEVDFNITDESIYLFKVRLMLEKTLSDLCEKTNYKGHKSMYEMIRHLIRCELINKKTADLLSQIIKISNRGVHGEIVSNDYIKFIDRILPELQKQLSEAGSQLHYCICPKCKYSGYSRYENVCPNCGFTSDDF